MAFDTCSNTKKSPLTLLPFWYCIFFSSDLYSLDYFHIYIIYTISINKRILKIFAWLLINSTPGPLIIFIAIGIGFAVACILSDHSPVAT